MDNFCIRDECHEFAHRYQVYMIGPTLVVQIDVAEDPEDPDDWDVSSRTPDPSPKQLETLLNHAYLAGMRRKEFEGEES